MNEAKREEPAAAANAVAAVADSERENICGNIFEPIISEIEAAVKPHAERQAEELRLLIAQSRACYRRLNETLIFLCRSEQDIRRKIKTLDKELIAIEHELEKLESGTDDGS